jgi:hypothetical protein
MLLLFVAPWQKKKSALHCKLQGGGFISVPQLLQIKFEMLTAIQFTIFCLPVPSLKN